MFSPYPKRIKPAEIKAIYEKAGGPFYIYDVKGIVEQVNIIKRAFKGLFRGFAKSSNKAGSKLTLRYALKANPHSFILRLLDELGVYFDASSIYEVMRVVKLGLAPEKIMLTSQEFSEQTQAVYRKNKFFFNATSLSQIERWGKAFPKTEISVRLNPGRSSGLPGKTTVAGKNSSFGIWHDYHEEVNRLAQKYDLKITKIHTHIGSGTDARVWSQVAKVSIGLLKHFPSAKTINLGGGFNVEKNPDDKPIDFSQIAEGIKSELEQFKAKFGRAISLELEPGKFLMAKSGLLVGQVNDITDNGDKNEVFLKLNIGMNDLLRPSLYGAQHPLSVVSSSSSKIKNKKKYYVIGHCCEESDVIFPKLNQPNLKEKVLLNEANLGDLVVVHQAGAYGKAMSSNYNSYPFVSEWIKDQDGQLREITRRGKLEDQLKNDLYFKK